MNKITKFCFCLLILITLDSYSQNLITNGDFGLFNAAILTPPPLGYQTSYIQIPYNAGVSNPRRYAITNNAFSVDNANFKTLFDHSSGDGKGNMMVVDGQNNEIFWKQNPNLRLQAGVTYVFSYWVVNVNRTVSAGNPAPKIRFNPSGCSSCSPQIVDVGLLPSVWTRIEYSITPSANEWIRIELSTVNAGPAGNNFAIDDVTLIAPTAQLTISNSKTNPTCPDTTDAAIVAYPNGGVAPYIFTLEGTATATNTTGIFQGLSAGSYTVSVKDSNTPPSVVTTSPILIASPLDISLISSSTGCNIAGAPIKLTASNGGTVYNWSASTGTPISDIDNEVIVNPLETTTYSVNSSTSALLTNPNLIGNGDFESGTSGFFSDYGYSTSNTTGAQFAYGVVSNPKDWFVDFISSTDHSGSGKMLVADGATNSNKVIWSQSLPVENNKQYTFSFWVQNLVANSPAQFQVLINDIPIAISPLSATNGATSGWTQISGTWDSNNVTIATIKIIDTNITAAGNDFALDDISFSTPNPKTCSLSTQLTITIGGTTPITDFSYQTPICKSGVNPKPTLAPGFLIGGSYSESTGLLSINSNTGEINLSASPSGIYTIKYSVESNLSTCQLAGFSTFDITIDSTLPAPLVITPVNYCINTTTATSLSATALSGATLKWYGTDETGGTSSTIASIPSTGVVGSTTYYVSQSIGACESSRSAIVVTISDLLAPSFTGIPVTVCSDSTPSNLPSISTNGIQGTWNPPTINTTDTTTYLFTPNFGQCATSATVTISINSNIVPTFNPIGPICSGGLLSPLSEISINGVTGVWTPALNNTATTTYLFTPNSGQCATSTSMTIIVNPNEVPTFSPIEPICSGELLSPLPTTSINNVIGTWSPDLDNTETTTYTFEPNSEKCATTQTLTIEVKSIPDISISAGCEDADFVLKVNQSNLDNLLYSWYNLSDIKIGNTPSIKINQKGTYKVEVVSGVCKASKNIDVNNVYCDIQKGISPNGDTKNDFFDLRNFSISKLEIFNRYGIKVYSKSEYKNEWDGTSDSGQELPDGTYYYVVDFESGKSKTGWVYLNREH